MNKTPDEDFINSIAAAVQARRPLPPMNVASLEEGYEVQKLLVGQVDAASSGLKAGITSAALQQKMGLDSPLVGTLYALGELQNGCELSLVDGQQLEFEIGVVIDGAGKPVGLVPVVEVVYLAFSRKEDFVLPNILAANLGADRYIRGDVVPWNPGLQTLNITVKKADLEVASLANDYSFGAPADGVIWMVQEARRTGLWRSDGKDERLLILGTCGKPLDGERGNYQISFGDLGELSFSVV